ncbi:hypothetical protein B0H16DRAFT_1690877 [Mycena metata]|uniref:Uncharacterized protein n=1 Tax=Mycena metata TaxID=1033252 RepID=A0AAD7NBF8_9AGAR|nr:hypothetical protein B0H16DRAFT_1690877 [Mycena metata]
MPSSHIPLLDKSDEDAIRTLHKSVRATSYEDAIDQDAFLVASARSILQFRKQVMSFALSSDLGECAFLIRTKMAQNYPRLGTPPGEIFVSISDFVGEIARSRQLIRDRKRAHNERVRAEEAVVARAARHDALEFAAQRDPDVVSIPSDDESRIARHPSPLIVKPLSATAEAFLPPMASPIQELSPIPELENLMFSLRLTDPFASQPSPSLPSPSQPGLVRIATPPPRSPVSERGRTMKIMKAPFPRRRPSLARNVVNPRMATPPPTPTSNLAVAAPRPFRPAPRHPHLNYVDDLMLLRRKSNGSHARKNKYLGNYKRSMLPPAAPHKPKALKLKRCFFCSATAHLIAQCPLREID